MRLYHGSNMIVDKPDVTLSRSNLDFGRGFYLTSHFDQASDWARRKAALEGSCPYVSVFDFAEDLDDLNVLQFDDHDSAWVEFVCDCRRGGEAYQGYDLIIGGVADDRVYYAVDMYYQGLWDMERTLEALRFYGVNDQWCFVSQRAVDSKLSFIEAREV